MMNHYLVFWQTVPGSATAFYKGQQAVWANDEEKAARIALTEVNRGLFRDCLSPSQLRSTIILKLEN